MRALFICLTLLPALAMTPKGVAPADWQQIRDAHQRSLHAVTRSGQAWQAQNPGQGWQMRFDGRGFTVKPASAAWTWGLALERFGLAGQERAMGQAQVRATENRVTYGRPGVEEWFVNDARGLEQGFTVRERPAGAGDTLVFDLAVRGGLFARAQGPSVDFVDGAGQQALRFGGLKAWDADGRSLAASFEAGAHGLRYRVEAAGARYPVTVDPVAQQAYLKASSPAAFDYFGWSVAISGETAVVGAPTKFNSGRAGAAYVFVRSAGVWTQQAILTASNPDADDYFGWSVAISGETVVVGAYGEASNGTGPGDNSAFGAGAAYVFLRSGVTWTQQAYLKASNPDANDNFGRSVAISGDTVVVGADGEASNGTGPGNNSLSQSGAAYVFTRTAGAWTQQAYLKASNLGLLDQFGWSVAISGETVVVAAYGEASNGTGPGDNSASAAGAAYVFLRSGVTWTQQAYLKASNPDRGDFFGWWVAISGETVVVGAPAEASNGTGPSDNSAFQAGAAYVFTRNAGAWTQQAYLKASNPGTFDRFGYSVAISGETVVVGAYTEASNGTGPGDNSASGAGAAYIFTRTAGAWTQQAYLKASNPDANDFFGDSVAISGETVVVGASGESSNGTGPGNNSAVAAGAAYVFTPPVTVTATLGTPQSTLVNTAFASLQATVRDSANNPVAGITVTFTAPVAGASGTFPGGLTTVTAMTSTLGVATAPTFTANGLVGGAYNVKATVASLTATPVTPANFALTNLPVTVQVTVTTNPTGPSVTVNGGTPFTGSQNFIWNIGTAQSLATTTPQLFNAGQSRYLFQSWSNGGTAVQTLNAPATPTTYTANFSIQHLVTVASPPGGTLSLSTAFYDANSVQPVTATPNPGFVFAGFTGALTGTTNPQNLTITGPLTLGAIFVPVGAFQVRYAANMNLGDSVVNITNSGARGADLAAGTSATTTGAICANVYAFSPDEQMISCCSCPVTPNGLVSLSARQDLISNTLTPAVPTSIVIKLYASVPIGGSCNGSAAAPGVPASGMVAFGTTVHAPAAPGADLAVTETRFLPATMSGSVNNGFEGIGELARLTSLCTFINANGSGFGICRSCKLGGLGAGRI